ncbi:ralA-binding protein 1 isoform X2 [Eupeodes corollae]|uniref:ralA-binding protein 1 isoform X2 n=1 Tax=Eupeodes corollae TaxID=290404 RepID=UPI00249379BC|nr:ralA-binding protein 1 isoform X2 [Eupeodes corollae]
MEFDSPDVEKDFPGLYASETGAGKKKEESDFSEGDHDKLSKKDLLIGRRKDKKDKKDRGYAALEGESSPEDDLDANPSKSSKKSKAFKFSSSKSKEKREKSRDKEKVEKDVKDKDEKEKDKDSKEPKDKKRDKDKKEKDKKDKSKDKEKKDKKSKAAVSEEVLELGDVQPVFSVSVSLATERSRCHDGIDLPLVVRDCIDYLQEHGLRSDQIYKVEPVKTRLQHFKRLYNNRESQGTDDMDVPTACGLLKLFLKELPEPILTTDLIARFEEVSSHPQVTQQEKELKTLLYQLPNCNKTLLSWILLHFDSVIQNEKQNKMNAQSLAMLLSPPLQMSHRLLVTLLCHCPNLFAGVELKKYIPPITSTSPKLPETPNDIQAELSKQESLLAQIHSEMNAGFVSKKREEQLWEVQRIITQLKRKLRVFEKRLEKSIEDPAAEIAESCTSTIIQAHAQNREQISCAATTTAATKATSDDESMKTLTIPSTESGTNTDTKNTPQDTTDYPSIIPEEQPPIKEITAADEGMYLHENGMLMLPKTHPDYHTLIRLQLENQELMNWKNQLQARISAERAEILRLKKFLVVSNTDQPKKCCVNDEVGDYDKIIENYMKENNLLEQKKNILAKQIFEENKELIALQVEYAMQKF